MQGNIVFRKPLRGTREACLVVAMRPGCDEGRTQQKFASRHGKEGVTQPIFSVLPPLAHAYALLVMAHETNYRPVNRFPEKLRVCGKLVVRLMARPALDGHGPNRTVEKH